MATNLKKLVENKSKSLRVSYGELMSQW